MPVIVIGGLSEGQRRAYQVADNRIPLDAGWDEVLLAEVLPKIDDASLDLVLSGFSDDELRGLLDDSPPEQAVVEWSLREHASPPKDRERLETAWTKLSRRRDSQWPGHYQTSRTPVTVIVIGRMASWAPGRRPNTGVTNGRMPSI